MGDGDFLTTSIAKKEMEVLVRFVNLGKKYGIQNFSWATTHMTPLGDYVSITNPVKIQEGLPAGNDFEDWISTLDSLAALGFVKFEEFNKRRGRSNLEFHLTLLPEGIKRVKYENQNSIRKIWTRTVTLHKTWMAVVGFFISVILLIVRLKEFL